MKLKNLTYLILFTIICGIYTLGIPDNTHAIANIKAQQLYLKAFTEQHLLQACLAYTLCYITACILLVPGTILLTLVAGILFGTAGGVLIAILASTTGATLTLIIYRNFFKAFNTTLKKQAIGKASRYFPLNRPISLLFLRLIPLIPFNALNIAMSLTKIKKTHYFLYSLLGMLPATYVVVNLGEQIENVHTSADLMDTRFILSFSLLGALLIGSLIAKKILDRKAF